MLVGGRFEMHAVVHVKSFMWNVDCSVGKGGQNSLMADISYIQWYYTLAATNPETPPDRKGIYQLVKLTGQCSGADDDPLVQAITVHERALKHPYIDGKISVAVGTGKLGDKAFFVYRIGARIARMFPNAWPRLDQMPSCPQSVIAEVKNAIPTF
jgi:hypothetical protein